MPQFCTFASTAAIPSRRLAVALLAAVLAAALGACAPAQSPAAEAPAPSVDAPAPEAVDAQDAAAPEEASPAEDPDGLRAEDAAPAASAPARATRADLQRLRDRIPGTADWTEMEALLRELRGALRDTESGFAYRELLHLEHAITADVAQWVAARTDRRGLGRGEACLADVQCADGACTGSGCLPGEWTCTPRLTPDQRVTMDMRTACLCSGTTFQGSTTVLNTHRVRSRGAPCPEEARVR